jgi:hypothetical protein
MQPSRPPGTGNDASPGAEAARRGSAGEVLLAFLLLGRLLPPLAHRPPAALGSFGVPTTTGIAALARFALLLLGLPLAAVATGAPLLALACLGLLLAARLSPVWVVAFAAAAASILAA